MWIKKIFKQAPIIQENNNANINQNNQFQSSVFQIEDMEEDTSPLVDQTPDLRYQVYKPLNSYSNLHNNHNKKLPIPLTLLHQKQSVLLVKDEEDGYECRSIHNDSFTLVKIVVTDRQIIILPNILNYSIKSNSTRQDNLIIYHGAIQKIEIKENKKEAIKMHLVMKDCKQIVFTNKIGDYIKKLQEILSKFCFVNGVNKFYAFKYKKDSTNKKHIKNGWQIYNIQKQFMRQGAYKFFSLKSKGQSNFKFAYRMIKNYTYQISPTYPPQFFVPFEIKNQQIQKCAKFRTKQRIPALTYFYQYKEQSYSTLFRCSQIKTGVMGNRCQEDQKMIKLIAQSSNQISHHKRYRQMHNIKIYDARGYYAALGNMLAGKGYQRQQNYNCQIQFLNIPNIHAVRQSYCKVKSYDPTTQQLLQVLSVSGWQNYLFLILSGAKSIAEDLMIGKNVLVHCSDGWDRTSQLCSLGQLLIDPYYRTIEGLAVLIQKDWRNFGHKFRQRTGQYHPTNYHPYQKSQVFIQFLDCIYQLISQFPLSFQYSHTLLQFLAINVDSCIYGTFLANNMKQGTQLKLEQQTISIWTDVFDQRQKYLNPFYRQDLNIGFLNVSLQMKNMRVWKQFLINQSSMIETTLNKFGSKGTILPKSKTDRRFKKIIIIKMKKYLQTRDQLK